MSKQSRYEEMTSERGMRVKVANGEVITVRADGRGTITLQSTLSPDHGGLGSFEITGLEPRAAAAKKKGFWRRLWDKIKEVAGDVLDAVTVPVFGYKCRPDITVDLKDQVFTLGISCKEA